MQTDHLTILQEIRKTFDNDSVMYWLVTAAIDRCIGLPSEMVVEDLKRAEAFIASEHGVGTCIEPSF